MRIALGSDHRGAKIAKAILSEVLFTEADSGVSAEELGKAGFDSQSVFVGAVLVTGDASKNGGLVGKKIENLLPSVTKRFDEDSSSSDPRTPHFRVDYPDIAAAVAGQVSTKQADFGILVCGTGIGMCIVANKFPTVRAALCANEFTAELSRKHNNANVLCIPGELLGVPAAVALVRRWLTTEYEGGRHQLRLEKIEAIEYETGL